MRYLLTTNDEYTLDETLAKMASAGWTVFSHDVHVENTSGQYVQSFNVVTHRILWQQQEAVPHSGVSDG